MVFEPPDSRSTARDNSVDATRFAPAAPAAPAHADHADATRVVHSPAADSEATRIARDARLNDLETEGTRILRGAPPARLALATGHSVAERYQIGDKIGGRYEVLAIHRGTMGVVYGTFDHTEKLPRALKTLQRRYAGDSTMRDLFAAEALTWVKLEKHPFIVRAYLVERFDNQPYVITEYIRGQENMGGDLRAWLGHPKLTLPIAVEMALQIAQGMQHAVHKVPGLLHRDLKPANILVDDRARAMVTDFGLVHAEEAGAGTPAYMAPEQWRAETLDIRTDIYAYGCILYEMFTGHRMYAAHSEGEWEAAHLAQVPVAPITLNPSLPPQISAFVIRCLAKQRTHRPANWDEVVLECARWFHEITGQPVVFDFSANALSASELSAASYSLAKLGKFTEALEMLDRALAFNPNYTFWIRKGMLLNILWRHEEALSANDRALALDANLAAAWDSKGYALQNLKRYEEALVAFDRALAIDPNDADAWLHKGVALQSLKRYGEALVAFDRALDIDPKNANAWTIKGVVFQFLQRDEEALSAHESALALETNSASAWTNKGSALLNLKRYEEALVAFDRALAIDPNNAIARAEKGIALQLLHRLPAGDRGLALDSNRAHPSSANGLLLQLSTLSAGSTVKGIVTHITDYGVFVDLGGIDGLLHISDLAWRRVKHPSEVLSVGDEITAKILKIDTEKNRVSLGLKQLGENPWVGIAHRYPEGTRLFGEVTFLTDHGPFVEIEAGIEGVVHVSEMDGTNNNVHPSAIVRVGEKVEVMILGIDEDRRRIALSMKRCMPNPLESFACEHKPHEETLDARAPKSLWARFWGK